MCRLCTYVRCVSVSNKHTHSRIPARGALGRRTTTRALAPGGPGLEIQQELTQQLSCLWFQKSVHLWSKLQGLSAYVFFKNKIHLQKWSFSSIPLPAVKKNPQPQIILIFLSLLIPAEVIYIFFSFLKANTKHTQDRTVCWNLNMEIRPYISYI